MDINRLKGAIPDSVIAQIPDVENKFSIHTPLRLAHFLSQCGHESWNFTAVVENLNYSEEALNRVFGKYFPDGLAKSYARQGQRIGSRVYANRMGNGDEASGEGFKYRGRGFIQLTGKVNYASFDKLVEENIIEQPELVATKYPLLSAAWYWNSRSLNAVADLGDSDAVVTRITKVVNGGMNGYDDRLKLFKKFYPILNAS